VGWFMWTPKQSLVADTTGYGLRIDVDGTQDYQYSTQFGISNSNPNPLNDTPGVKPLPVNKPLSIDNKPLPVDKPTTPTPGNPTPANPNVVYQTHYVTVTDCSCPTGVPSPPGYGTPGTPGHGTPGYGTPGTPGHGTPGYGTPGYSPAYPSGVPGKYHNSSISNTTYGGPAQYTGAATHAKAGGLLIAFAAGIGTFYSTFFCY
jgi:hypothetical protein